MADCGEGQQQGSSGASPLGILLVLVVVAALAAGGVLAWRYWKGQWAPSRYDGGLSFAERPVFLRADGKALDDRSNEELIDLLASLRSTSRHVADERGVELRYRLGETGTEGVITIFPKQNAVFNGYWLDARSYRMRGARAPCFRSTRKLTDFAEEQGLLEAR